MVGLYKLGEIHNLTQRNDEIQSYQDNDLTEILENESMYHILNTLKLKDQKTQVLKFSQYSFWEDSIQTDLIRVNEEFFTIITGSDDMTKEMLLIIMKMNMAEIEQSEVILETKIGGLNLVDDDII